jgi:hypothetical protein
MFKAADLNFVMVIYVDNAKVIRIPCNFLMAPRIYDRILNHFIPKSEIDTLNYYSSFEIEYNGSIVYKNTIRNYYENGI